MSEWNGQKEESLERLRLSPVPVNWEWAAVQDLGEVRLGRQRSPKHRSAKYPTRYLRAANITWNGFDLSDVLEMEFKPHEREVYALRDGDVLLSEASGSPDEVGKPAIWKSDLPECCFQNTIIRFRPTDAVDATYARFVFLFYARNGVFTKTGKGVGIHHLSAARFSRLPFPVAPRGQQRRIVAKLEELFSDLDAGVAALERARASLKRYRAAVLKAAVEGRLTEKWRAEHPDVEPADKLLQRILTERRRRWIDDQLTKWRDKRTAAGWAAAKIAAAEPAERATITNKYNPPAAPDTTNLPGLPTGWCWATVEQLGEVQLGRQRSPKNRSKDFPTKYVRAANITEDGLNLSDILDMEFRPKELERYQLAKGDVIISEASGSPDQVGKPAVWNDELEMCCFQNTVIRLRPFMILSGYLLTVFRHCYTNQVFAKVAAGVGINHLSAAKFAKIAVPLAPDAEQHVVFEEVELRLSVLKQTELQLHINRARAARLRQAVLKRAFEGKLVPQDPSDEPADALLARIRATRQVEANTKKPTRKRTPRGGPATRRRVKRTTH